MCLKESQWQSGKTVLIREHVSHRHQLRVLTRVLYLQSIAALSSQQSENMGLVLNGLSWSASALGLVKCAAPSRVFPLICSPTLALVCSWSENWTGICVLWLCTKLSKRTEEWQQLMCLLKACSFVISDAPCLHQHHGGWLPYADREGRGEVARKGGSLHPGL